MLILFFLSFLPCVGWWLWRGERNLNVSISDPIIAFSIYYGVFFFLGGAVIVSQEMYLYNGTYSRQAIIETYIGFLVFQLCVVMSYGVFGRNAGSNRIGNAAEDCRKWMTLDPRQLVQIGVVLLVPATVSALYTMRLIAQHGFVEYMRDRIIIMSGKGFILLPAIWFFSYFLLYWVNKLIRAAKSGGRSLGTMVFLVAALAGASGLLQGSRSKAFLPFVFMLGLWWLLTKRRTRLISTVVIVSCLCGIVVAGVVLGKVRQNVAGGSGDLIQSGDTEVGLRLVVLGLNPLRVVENTVWLVENMRDKDMMFGSTFYAVVTGLVPRVLWENKPLGGGPALRNLISPGSYDLQSGKNLTTYSPGIVAEAYLNFGFAGFLMAGIVYGIGLAALGRAYSRVQTTTGYVMWIYGLYALLGLLTGEVFGSVAGAVGILLPIAVATPFLAFLGRLSRIVRSSAVTQGN